MMGCQTKVLRFPGPLKSQRLAMTVLWCACLTTAHALPADIRPLDDEALAEVTACADNLIAHARDHYGSEATPLFVSQLNCATLTLPPADSTFYASSHRGGAGPTTCNLQFDSGLLRLFYALTEVTGRAQYAAAADQYLRYYLENLPEAETGFFPWGDHRGYDVVSDSLVRGPHEFKVTFPPWEELYRIDPEAVTRQIESLRRHVIDAERSWGFNRHYPPGALPHSMNSSGGAYIAAWAFLFNKTKDPKYLAWAEGMADYLWSLRNPDTDLLAAHPYDPAYPKAAESERARARASRTEYMGQITFFAPNLLHAARLVGPPHDQKFRAQAVAYYRAFTDRMDIQENGAFYATFDVATGEPLFPRIEQGWNYLTQLSPPINWGNGVVGIRALFSIGFGYRETAEPALREAFDRLRPLARLDSFRTENNDAHRVRAGNSASDRGERGTPPTGKSRNAQPPETVAAGLLAQTIVGYLDMYRATGCRDYLDDAGFLARYARRYYFRGGWFVCGVPTVPRYRDADVDPWRTYSNRGGSDDLALAVLRVWLAEHGREDPVVSDPGCYF